MRMPIYTLIVCVCACDSRVHIGGLTSDLFSFRLISRSCSRCCLCQCDNRVLRISSSHFDGFHIVATARIEVKRIQSRFVCVFMFQICGNHVRFNFMAALFFFLLVIDMHKILSFELIGNDWFDLMLFMHCSATSIHSTPEQICAQILLNSCTKYIFTPYYGTRKPTLPRKPTRPHFIVQRRNFHSLQLNVMQMATKFLVVNTNCIRLRKGNISFPICMRFLIYTIS